MYGFLTKKNNGSYGLPLTESFRNPKQFAHENVVHGSDVWRKWSDAQLAEAGATVINDVTKGAVGKIKSSGFTDAYSNNNIQRTYTLVDIPYEPELAKLLGRVNGRRDYIINAGINVTIRDEAHVLETQSSSRDLISGTIASIGAGISLPDGFSWRMRDNTDVALNSTEMVTIGAAVLSHINAAHTASRVHKDAIAALAAWGAVNDYDLDAGWPDVAEPEGI